MSKVNGQQNTSKLRTRVFTVFYMLVVTFVFTSAVSLTYLTTKETIEINERLFMRRAVLYAAGISVPDSSQDVVELFEARVRPVEDVAGEISHFQIVDGSKELGCVFRCSGAGLWGTIDAVVGFDETCTELTGLDFTRQNETPGLGGRIAELWFKEQFRGKRAPFTIVSEGAKDGPQEFDGVTGATITSTAVRDLLNELCEKAKSMIGGKSMIGREAGAGGSR